MNKQEQFNVKITHIELKDHYIILTGYIVDGVSPAPPPAPSVPTAMRFESDVDGDCLLEGPEAITIQEASKTLHCSDSTIENMRKDGRLKSYYRGRNVRLRRQQVEGAKEWWSVAKGKI